MVQILLDPTGTSLTLTDETSQEAAHLLYDAYGGVLESDISDALLATALADQGSLADPDTGLVHLGNGRWYNPALGRPLQPDPAGGPPTVPQALNRYAATALGQPGVAQAVTEGYNWLPDAVGLVKGAALEAAALYPVVIGYRYVGQASLTVQASRSALARKIPEEFRNSFTDLKPTQRASIFEQTASFVLEGGTNQEVRVAAEQIETALMAALPKRAPWTATVLLDLKINPLAQKVKLGNFLSFKVAKTALGPVLDAGIGGYLQYLDDKNNPYLTPGVKVNRIIVAGGGSVGASFLAGALLGCGTGIGCGISAAIIGTAAWLTVQPIIFNKIPGLKPSDRNLQPLGTP